MTLLLNAAGVALIYLAWERAEPLYLVGAVVSFVAALVLSASRYRA